jgi:hypothetical protein
LERAGADLGRQNFACQQDAETAAGAWLQQSGYHRLTADVVAGHVRLKRARPGRPARTSPWPRAKSGGLLEEYKWQGSVERRFAFCKDPEIVDAFFVKKPERVLALGYVLVLVCLVFSVLERRVRRMRKPLPTKARGPPTNPTAQEILDNLPAVVVLLEDGTRVLHVPRRFRPTFDAVLRGTRIDREAYTQPPPRCVV